MPDIIFEPLKFKNLTVKNRVFRSNIAGRLDNYDGSGNQARINWEEKFARGGVGAIISSFVPVQLRGRIMPNYATVDSDERIPFWRKVGEAVHRHDCKYIMQLSHGGGEGAVPGRGTSGGPLQNRARCVIESVKAIRPRVGSDFHLQMKISATEFNNALLFVKLEAPGNTVTDSIQVCQWLIEAGVDSIHVST